MAAFQLIEVIAPEDLNDKSQPRRLFGETVPPSTTSKARFAVVDDGDEHSYVPYREISPTSTTPPSGTFEVDSVDVDDGNRHPHPPLESVPPHLKCAYCLIVQATKCP